MFNFELYCYDEDNEPYLLFEDLIPFEVKTAEELLTKFDMVALLNDIAFELEDTSSINLVFVQKESSSRDDIFAFIGTYLPTPEAGNVSEEFFVQITPRQVESREIQNYMLDKEAA